MLPSLLPSTCHYSVLRTPVEQQSRTTYSKTSPLNQAASAALKLPSLSLCLSLSSTSYSFFLPSATPHVRLDRRHRTADRLHPAPPCAPTRKPPSNVLLLISTPFQPCSSALGLPEQRLTCQILTRRPCHAPGRTLVHPSPGFSRRSAARPTVWAKRSGC